MFYETIPIFISYYYNNNIWFGYGLTLKNKNDVLPANNDRERRDKHDRNRRV